MPRFAFNCLFINASSSVDTTSFTSDVFLLLFYLVFSPFLIFLFFSLLHSSFSSLLAQAEVETLRRELEAAQMEGIRFKELSEISSLQAQSIGSFKQQHMDELTSLR